MNFRLDHKMVRTERPIGTASQQTIFEGSFELPPSLPDVARIVRVEARPAVTDWDVMENQLAVQGTVDLVLLYAHDEEVPAASRDIEAESGLAEDDDADLAPPPAEVREALYRHCWSRAGTFETVLDLEGLEPAAAVDVSAHPERVDVELHQSGRRIEVEAVVDVTARATLQRTAVAPVKAGPLPAEAAEEEAPVPVKHVAGRGSVRLAVEGVLAPAEDAAVARIADVAAVARITRAEASAGQVTVQGTIDYRVLYLTASGELVTAAFDAQTPYSYTFDIPEAREGMTVEVEARARSVDGAPAGDGREIQAYVDLSIAVEVSKVETLALLTAIRGSEGLEVDYRTAPVELDQWIGSARRHVSAAGTLELPEGHPPIERALSAFGRARVDDVLVLDDKVVVEGHVDVEALYAARTEGHPVHAATWSQAVPFEAEVALPGAEPGVDAVADVNVEGVELDLLNRETVEAAVHLAVTVWAVRPAAWEAVVEAVAVPPPDPDPPTWTFVVIQEGDTVWKLSRRYHADPEQIVGANPWIADSEAPLVVGRKLCIPRRRPAEAISP
ncbi:MAG: DUF3794 domain-containing protein [Firmicutes bacterium]|nr:DUF3794 domain-containing protein [Bacillota bacterium]